ncbi:42997_t:CDS:1, partial [Gigaspora margarita]
METRNMIHVNGFRAGVLLKYSNFKSSSHGNYKYYNVKRDS